jgi:hypothetical protein
LVQPAATFCGADGTGVCIEDAPWLDCGLAAGFRQPFCRADIAWGNHRMRPFAIAVFCIALALVAASVSIVALLSTLDGRPDEQQLVDLLLRGEVHRLYLMPVVWQCIPGVVGVLHCWTTLCSPWAFAPMACITAAVLWSVRRCRAINFTLAGLSCLSGAALPWAAGAFMLSHIEQPGEAGRWILTMIGNLFWGAVVCAACAGWHLARTGRRGLEATPLPAAT